MTLISIIISAVYATTCGDVKHLYKDSDCCNADSTADINTSSLCLDTPCFDTPCPDCPTCPEPIVEKMSRNSFDPTVENVGSHLKLAIFSEPKTNNYFKFLHSETDIWTNLVMTSQSTSLFKVADPTKTLIPNAATKIFDSFEDVGKNNQTYNSSGLRTDSNYAINVKLTPGAKWRQHDVVYDDVTADDFVWTMNTMNTFKLLGCPAGLKAAFDGEKYSQGVLAYEVVDKYTIRITFNYKPGLSVWQYGLGACSFMSKKYWEPFASTDTTLLEADGFDAPVSDFYSYKAYAYTSYHKSLEFEWPASVPKPTTTVCTKGLKMTVTQEYNEFVYGTSDVDKEMDYCVGEELYTFENGPFATDVQYVLFESQEAANDALSNKYVHAVANPLGMKKDTYEKTLSDDYLPLQNEDNGMRYMAFNLRVPPFNNKALRQAIACVMDKPLMETDVFYNNAINLDGQIVPALADWVAPVSGVLEECRNFDPKQKFDKAIEILQKGNWTADDWGSHPGGVDRPVSPTGLKMPDGNPPPADMILSAPGVGYDPIRCTSSMYIANSMRELGFDMVAYPEHFQAMVERVFNPLDCTGWNAYILGWGLSDFPDHMEAFFAGKNDVCGDLRGYNTPGFNNKQFDDLVALFNGASTISEAQYYSLQMETILFDELPYIVLWTVPKYDLLYGVMPPYVNVLGGYNLGKYPIASMKILMDVEVPDGILGIDPAGPKYECAADPVCSLCIALDKTTCLQLVCVLETNGVADPQGNVWSVTQVDTFWDDYKNFLAPGITSAYAVLTNAQREDITACAASRRQLSTTQKHHVPSTAF